jgi:hypothetical protein
MNLDKPKTVPLLTIVEHCTKTIAVLAAAMLLTSIFYDYSFLSALDLSFADIPSATAEHVRSALIWAPLAVLVIFIASGHELWTWRKRDRLPESYQLRLAKPPLTFSYKQALVILLFAVPIIGDSRDRHWMYVAGLVTLVGLMLYLAHDEEVPKKIGEHFFFGVLLPLPVVFMIVGFCGYIQGEMLAYGSTPNWELSLRAGTAVNKRTVTGLRRFSSFAIIVDEGHFVSIIPNDSIVEAKRLKALAVSQNNFCQWFNLRCDPPKTPKTAVPMKPAVNLPKSMPSQPSAHMEPKSVPR